MQILWATTCRNVARVERGVVSIDEAGLNTFIVDDLPAEVAFKVVLHLSAAVNEVGDVFEIPVELWSPDQKPIAVLDVEVAVDPPDGGTHPLDVRVTDFHELDVTFDADGEGIYSVEIRQPEWRPTDPPDAVRGCPVFFFVMLSKEARQRIDEGPGSE